MLQSSDGYSLACLRTLLLTNDTTQASQIIASEGEIQQQEDSLGMSTLDVEIFNN